MTPASRLVLGLLVTAAVAFVNAPAGAIPCTELSGVSDRCEDWVARASIGWAEDVLVDPGRGLVYVAATALGPTGDTNGDVWLHAYDAATGDERWSLSRDGGAAEYDAANDLILSEDGSQLCASGGVVDSVSQAPGGSVPGGYDIFVACVRPETGEVLWERTYDMPTGRDDTADGGMVMASVPFPDGSTRERLFVGGFSGLAPFQGDAWKKDLLTLAIDPSNGHRLWAATYDGPAGEWEVGRGIGVSPDGTLVFVTGESAGSGTSHDYATVAYDTFTGQQVWASRYQGPEGSLADEPNALTVSPDGDVVVVTGASEETAGSFRWATVAYDADTGQQLWASRFAGTPPPAPIPENARPLNSGPTLSITGDDDEAAALAFSPDSGTVYVTGYARAFPNATDYVTVAYRSSDGTALWDASYDGPTHRHDGATAVTVSPSGDRIYVTGDSGAGTLLESRYTAGTLLDDAATVAYDSSGNQLWSARYDGGEYLDEGSALALSGGQLFVAGMAGWHDQAGVAHVDPVLLRYAA